MNTYGSRTRKDDSGLGLMASPKTRKVANPNWTPSGIFSAEEVRILTAVGVSLSIKIARDVL